jgi:YesN/AraC family two-component response regulator
LGWLKIEYDYIVSMGMSVFIYFLGYQGLTFSFQQVEILNQEKYSSSNLTAGALESIEKLLDSKMKNEKYYLNSNLRIQELAEQLEVNLHSLSQTINTQKKKSFNDYINEYRIDEAKNLMLNAEYQDTKLINIAYDTGFNNKTSFLNAFKKHTHQSPSEFRKSILTEFP